MNLRNEPRNETMRKIVARLRQIDHVLIDDPDRFKRIVSLRPAPKPRKLRLDAEERWDYEQEGM